MRYLIDGHNLVFAMKNGGDQLAGFEVSHTAQLLCKVLEEYMHHKRSQAVLYFDGCGPHDRRFYHNFTHVNVFWAGDDYEADDFIIGDVEADTAPKSLVVVSTDRRVKEAAKRRKCHMADSFDFWCDMVEYVNKPKRKKQEPQAKTNGLSESEVAGWMKTFGFKDD
ncbi:MAG: NYN domain-containing protein [Phycisphaerae bacterium]